MWGLAPPADPAERRARDLLLAHLSPEQRVAYLAGEPIRVVKRGIVWSVVLRDALVLVPVLAGLALPGWRMAAILMTLTLLVGLLPLWGAAFMIACSRRREWRIGPWAAPELRVRGYRIGFCVRFDEELPAGDRVLAWKNVIEGSEPYFLRTANVIFKE